MKPTVQSITQEVAQSFRCFGGGNVTYGNPISHALKDEPPQFAAGVDVESVVAFVLERVKGK